MIKKKPFYYLVLPCMIAAIIASYQGSTLHNLEKKNNALLSSNTSADGKYVVTTNKNHDVIVWDYEHDQIKLLTHHASNYKAHFIKNTHKVIWQDNQTLDYHVTCATQPHCVKS